MAGLGVHLSHCSVRLGGRAVLRDVTVSVRPGEKWLICGANGAGKTQLVKLLAGLRWPSPDGRGRRSYADTRGREVELVDARDVIAYVGAESQDKYARYGWNHTLAEVVTTGLFGTDIPLDRPDAGQRRRVQSLLKRFNLVDVAARRMLEVSYGQRRLALVARAVASRPRLLLLDEVFNGLDAGHRLRLQRALATTTRTQVTLVVTAHRPEDVPAGLNHAAWVDRGRVTRLAPAQVLARLTRQAEPGASTAARGKAGGSRAPRVALRGVSVYRDGRPALRAIDWTLEEGDHWLVTGRNGGGKSTFLGLLYGAYPAALGGQVRRRGHPPGTPLEDIRRRIGFVSPELQAEYDPHSTLEEIVVSGLRGSVGLDTPATRAERAAASRALRLVGLTSLAGRRSHEVSYGELRLALIARSWVHAPKLLLLDEPYTGLDPARRSSLHRALDLLASRGTQIVIAVHHRDEVPSCVNRRLHLTAGRASEQPLRPPSASSSARRAARA